MQLDELKKSMSTLDNILAATNTEVHINVESSKNAQSKLLGKFRQASTSAAILAVIFAVLWITGVNSDSFPSYLQAFLVIYLVVGSVWYIFLYLKLRSISIPLIKPAQLFSKVATLKLLTLSGEILFGVALAVFFTLLFVERLINNSIARYLFFATLAFALLYGLSYLWPQYIRLFRELTTIDSESDSPEYNMPQHSMSLKWIAYSGIAAVVVILVAVAIYNPFRATGATLPAPELVVKAMEEVANAREHRVDFSIRASRSYDEDAYRADFDAEMVNGTLYLSTDSADEHIRVVFDDPEKTVVSQSVRLNNLLDLNSVVKEFKDNKEFVFTEEGNSVIVTSTNRRKEGTPKFKAIFSKKECKLKSVTVTAEKDGQEKIMLLTRKIEYR